MSDDFYQDVAIRWAAPVRPWRIMSDLVQFIEGAMGPLWSQVKSSFTALSTTDISFESNDLVSLQQRFEDYGGSLKSIRINADAHPGGNLFLLAAYVFVDDGVKTSSAKVTWNVPSRADAESFGYSVLKSVDAMRSRKRWAGARTTFSKVVHHSTAGESGTPHAYLSVRATRWRLRRWFVRNRDGIIVSLATGIIASIAIIFLQLSGVLPVPSGEPGERSTPSTSEVSES
ncbi:hypothetical protein ACFZA2_14065 [Microbacterium sp. NPDC007973]|uniref:hypothetical protein n=1 Tax=Microbacterium sp. NPDC007973 TaxID=3364182 RepID=UPI0036EF98E2